MVRFIHKEQSEITMDYANLPGTTSARRKAPKSCSAEDREATGRKLYRLVAVSFGLLCVLQAALNISLRLVLYSSDSKTLDTEAGCRNWTEETAELKRKLINFDIHYFQQGWVYLRPSFYLISSVKKSWQESRDDCQQRGSDLVIINSKQEQDFVRNFHKFAWIGLTIGGTKEVWKWVDGTPLTTSYWGPGEPNGYQDKLEDCVELRFHDIENSWNDIPCTDQNFWICEKIVHL